MLECSSTCGSPSVFPGNSDVRASGSDSESAAIAGKDASWARSSPWSARPASRRPRRARDAPRSPGGSRRSLAHRHSARRASPQARGRVLLRASAVVAPRPRRPCGRALRRHPERHRADRDGVGGRRDERTRRELRLGVGGAMDLPREPRRHLGDLPLRARDALTNECRGAALERGSSGAASLRSVDRRSTSERGF